MPQGAARAAQILSGLDFRAGKRHGLACIIAPSAPSCRMEYRKNKSHFSAGLSGTPPPQNSLGASQCPPLAATPHSRRQRRPQYPAAACRSGVQQGVARQCAVWTCGSGCIRLRTQGIPGARALGEGSVKPISNGILRRKGIDRLPWRVRCLWDHTDVCLVERE